jgi:TetR/AcrR family transcriptional regulator
MARTRAQDYDDKRNSILRTSAQVFAEEGYDRSSMSKIADACHVSKALLYHYYDNKEQLLFDILDAHLDGILSTLRAVDTEDVSPEERLLRLITALLDVYKDADAEHKVQVNALATLPPETQAGLKAKEREIVAIFLDAFAGISPAVDANPSLLKPVVMSLFGILNWKYMWFKEGGPLAREEYARIATTLIINGARGL